MARRLANPARIPHNAAMASSPPLSAVPSAELEAASGLSLPHNIEAEQALLGALMLDNSLCEDIMMLLRREHFFEPLHGEIYEAILRMVDHNLLASPVTLKPKLEALPALAELGGMRYIVDLAGNADALVGARDFARQIYDLALLRELVRVGRDMVENAVDTTSDIAPEQQIQEAEVALYRVAETGGVRSGHTSFGDAAAEAIRMVDKARRSGGHLSGVTTGLVGLNNMIGGLHNSDLVILAGRPGMGKTALATNMAFAAAQRALMEEEQQVEPQQRNGAAIAFFSLEMSSDQLAARILAEQARISSEDLRKGKIDREQFQHLARVSQELERLPFFIDDTPALSIAALRTRARRMKRQQTIGLIVVDYLQLLQGSGRGGTDNRVQELSEITRGLKTLAKELSVPVLALSQLSRAVENREDKKPQLADLRESGTIEQDADMVLFVYREEYYHNQKKPEEGSDKFAAWLEKGERIRGHAELLVAKQRHGATGTVDMQFIKEYTRFTDLADDRYLPAHH